MEQRQEIKGLITKIREELPEMTAVINQHLTKIEELVSTIDYTEEDKKQFQELGISADDAKKKLVWEIKRLGELFAVANSKEINLYFATEKAFQEQLEDKNALTEKKDDDWNIYLQLERKDKQGNFAPNLVFWTLTQELTTTNFATAAKDPVFWQQFSEDLNWMKENLSPEYQKEFELLLTPSTFPHELLEIKELLPIYFPHLEEIAEQTTIQTKVSQKLVDKVWEKTRQELTELISQELEKSPSEDKLKELGIKATIDYNSNDQEQEYTIKVDYHKQSPLQKQLAELIVATPLRLENAELKQKQEELPNPENFAKLMKQKKILEEHLYELTDKEYCQKIKKEIEEVK